MGNQLLTREQQIMADLQRDEDIKTVRMFIEDFAEIRPASAAGAIEAFSRLFPQQEHEEHGNSCD